MGEDRAVRDADGWTALDRAAGRGDVDRIRALLAGGVDPAEPGPDGRTPYEIALSAGHREAALLLRPAGGDHGWRPYCRAYRYEQLRAFPGWVPSAVDEPAGDEAVFLHDDLTVTRSAWPGEDVLFAGGGEQWTAFCRDALGFAVPDELDLSVPGDRVGAPE